MVAVTLEGMLSGYGSTLCDEAANPKDNSSSAIFCQRPTSMTHAEARCAFLEAGCRVFQRAGGREAGWIFIGAIVDRDPNGYRGMEFTKHSAREPDSVRRHA